MKLNLFSKFIAKDLANGLKNDLVDAPYSILIDKWSDITIKAYPEVVILLTSNKLQNVDTKFLGPAKLNAVDYEYIFNALNSMLTQFVLKYRYLIGFRSDKKFILIGFNNS